MFEYAHVCRQSLRRCSSNPRFMDVFYDNFLASSDEVAEQFANTDFDRQKEMLNKSLHMIVLACGGHDEGDAYLLEIAKRHGRDDLKIKPELYDLWLASLMATVQEIDPEYTPEVELAWRETMHYGIEYMLEYA